MMLPDQMPPVHAGPTPPPGPLRLFLRMGGWGVIGLGTLVVGLSLWAEYDASLARQFAETGQRTQARVLDHVVQAQLNVDGSVSYRYLLDLGFVTADGEQVRIARPVSGAQFRAVPPGAPIDLRYLPDRPDHVTFGDLSAIPTGRGAQNAALGIGAVTLWLLWAVGRRAVSAVRARRFGTSDEVEITAVRRSIWRAVDGERYRLIWRDADGREGHSLLHKKRDLAEIAPGTRVMVYRDGPHLWWQGDVGARA